MSEDVLLRTRHDRVTMLRLNRPDRLNAMSEELLAELDVSLTEIGADSNTDALVLTGAGRAFSAGGDVRTLTAWQELQVPERRAWFERAARVAERLAELPIPVVAAVNGAAAGAGFDLVLAADLCLAAPTATFGSGFVQLGLVPDMGGAWLLPRVVGLSRARRLILGGERIDAETARDWGIVARVVEDNELYGSAIEAAAGLASAGTKPAYAAAKRALLDGAGSFADALRSGAAVQTLLMDTPEHRHRAARFLAGADRRG